MVRTSPTNSIHFEFVSSQITVDEDKKISDEKSDIIFILRHFTG